MGRAWWAVLVVGVVGAVGCAGTNPSQDVSLLADQNACTPLTCGRLNSVCGVEPDGCGGWLDCGVCAGGATCTAGMCCGGNPDPCAADTASTGGALEFLAQSPGIYTSVSSDPAGRIFAAHLGESGSVVEQLDSTGRPVWNVTVPEVISGLLAAPNSNDLFAMGTKPSSTRASATPEQLRFQKTGGAPLDSHNLLGGARGLAAVGFDNSHAYVGGGAETGKLQVMKPSGELAWDFPKDQLPISVSDAAFDMNGNVLVGGHTTEAFDWNGASWARGVPFIAKLGPDGSVTWARQLNVPGKVTEVEATANGIVHFAGTYNGIFVFGADLSDAHGSDSAFVAGFDASGNQIFGQSIGPVDGLPHMGMDLAGTTYVALDRPDCGPMEIMKFLPGGQESWRRVLASKCGADRRVTALSVTKGVPVVAGSFAEAGQLDGRPFQAGGFVIKLKP